MLLHLQAAWFMRLNFIKFRVKFDEIFEDVQYIDPVWIQKPYVI
jgi:hypothetical protein